MKVTFFEKKSLKFRIISLTLGLTALLGVTAMILVTGLAQKARISILKTFEIHANSLQAAIGSQFFERYREVQSFAENPQLQFTRQDQLTEYLNRLVSRNEIYDLILFVDNRGSLLAANNKASNGNSLKVESLYRRSYADTSWFKSALTGQFTQDNDRGINGTFFEDPHIDPIVSSVYGGKQYGTSFTAQVKNSKGEVIGVLSCRGGFHWVENEFQDLFLALKTAGFAKTELTLLDKTGKMLVDYDPSQRGGNTELVHDFSIIGNLNLAQTGVTVANEALSGKSGAEMAFHFRKKVEVAAGYSPVKHRKFPSSLGWVVLVRSEPEGAFSSVDTMERLFFVVFTLIVALAVLISFLFSSSLAETFYRIADQLKAGAEEVSSTSKQVALASTSLSNSTMEQSAALQETVASINEVSAMVGKNADNAQKSQEVSESCQAIAEKGKHAVGRMIISIEDINQSNSNIMQEIEASNREISGIVKVITEIGNKTKVINDIVFQTKLLSFNASVEAARAGEHGRGFAVVAEEVGSLAQMSGNAAKEISTMLEDSIKKVESIIAETKTRVERLMASGKEKVDSGTLTARKCGEVLDEIVGNVRSVNQMVEEIAKASQEQAQGVGEITKAMNELDEVTQQNAAASQDCSEASDGLRHQADNLKGIVRSLLMIMQGVGVHRDQNEMKHSGGDSLAEGDCSKERQSDSDRSWRSSGSSHSKRPDSGYRLSSRKRESHSKQYPHIDHKLKRSTTEESIPSEDDPRFEDV
ncbi:MAG: methyl-accepting chemotaxis protein [Bdellovibrionia bacterium]